ncbi:hypothetical protein HMPREF9278_0719 [Mobiluncus mulieris FB024-16]|nr:hypothetical protein HMPREF9278_0719 [Mobiluncus mulieris FB024-16]
MAAGGGVETKGRASGEAGTADPQRDQCGRSATRVARGVSRGVPTGFWPRTMRRGFRARDRW